jgi:thiol:disulfide interchange protein DsbA
MKHWIIAGLTALWLAPPLAAADILEGRQYMTVPFPAAVETGKRIEVREFFWYGCPHCYVLEPGLERWRKRLPAQAQFVRTPGTASPAWSIHAQAYYAFEALGVADKWHSDFFKAVQEHRREFSEESGIEKFAAAHGVPAQKFREAFNSFGVRLKLERARQLNQDLNINSVPTVVVDGRYLTSPAMAEGEENFFRVLDFLIKKAAEERKPQARR